MGYCLARELKVYKDAEKLLLIVTKMTFHFPRLLKFSLGDMAIKACAEMITCIQMINLQKNPSDRLIWFDEYIVYEEKVRTFIGACVDTKKPAQKAGEAAKESASAKMYAEYINTLSVVGRQMLGWKSHTEHLVEQQSKVPESA